jgi:hypothetical protein
MWALFLAGTAASNIQYGDVFVLQLSRLEHNAAHKSIINVSNGY